MNTETNESLTDMLSFFKALADESRLKILGAVAMAERSVEELASMLALQGPTVSHHLARLKKAQLVTLRREGTTHLYSLNPDRLALLSKQILSMERLLVDDSSFSQAWEQKVLRDFFEDGRLKQIPASRKKRKVILLWLVDRFDQERRYSEKEVNETIGRYHEDFATLRRELIGADLMQRTTSGTYWRTVVK